MSGTQHATALVPSLWVVRFAPLIPTGGRVLDFACGSGRHAKWLAGQGLQVEAVDRDASALETLSSINGVATRLADLEGGDWPYVGTKFDAVVVTNYLYRPRHAMLLDCLASNGVLIYETFMSGNERFGKPSNPEFLLRQDELLSWLGDEFTLVAFEQGDISMPRAAAVQRICAVKSKGKPIPLP